MREYAERLEHLRQRLRVVAEAARDADEPDFAARAEALAQRLAPRRFEVAVVGEFKAGKSTLVNALLGRELLPSAARECTGVVTLVRQARADERPGVTLTLGSGASVESTLDALDDLLTVHTASINTVPVVHAEVRLESLPFDGDVGLTDTPGVGAAGLVREMATLHYLPCADAIVFLTRADALLSDSEFQFLAERVVRQDVARVFVVVNFADRIGTAQDRNELEERARARLAPVLGEVRLFFLSARDALESVLDGDDDRLAASGLPAFREALVTFLRDERAGAELALHERRVQTLQTDLTRALRQAHYAASLDADAAERRRARVEELIDYARRDGEAMIATVAERFQAARQGPIASLIEQSGRDLEAELDGLNRRAEQRDVSAGEARAIADRLGGRAQARVQGAVREEIDAIHRELAGRLNTLFDVVDAELSVGATAITLAPLDFAGLVQVRAHTEDVYDKVARKATAADPDAKLVGAGIVGTVGLIVLGPVGAILGAMIGWGVTDFSSSYTQKLYGTIKRTITRQLVDARAAACALTAGLTDGVREALDAVATRTTEAVRAVVQAKIAELEKRRDELDQANRGDAQLRLHRLGKALARLGVTDATLPRLGNTSDTSGQHPE